MFNANVPAELERNAMWAKDVKFCPPMGELTPTAISELLQRRVFSASDTFSELLRLRYEKMSANLPDVPHTSRLWEQSINGQVCITMPCHCKPDARLAVPTQCIGSNDNRITALYDKPCFGLDLPVWFQCRELQHHARIMFIAQDPLRTDPRGGYLYVSSPWALHSQDFRRSETKSIPHLTVNCLLAQGACIYLTDASKIFAVDHDYSAEYILPNFCDTFRDVLREEIRMFTPDLIVAIGEPASRKVLALDGADARIKNWNKRVIPRPEIVRVDVGGRDIPCVMASHFTRVSSFRLRLKADAKYRFIPDGGNENYVQYYTQAINAALNDYLQ